MAAFDPSGVNFPLKELTKLTEDATPNAFEIQNLKKEVIGCVRAIPTALGGDVQGHLGLVVPAAEYAVIVGAGVVPWVTPNYPATPVLGGGAGAAATVNAQMNHQAALHQYHTCMAVEARIKAMIIDAVPRVYIEAVEDAIFGFGNVTAETILTHLVTTYGTISQNELANNLTGLADAFNPDVAIETYFSTANKRRAFATAGGEPIPDGIFIRQLLHGFEKSGVMQEGLKDWYKKPAADQTRANLVTHFTAANKERKRMITFAGAGYQTANAAKAKQESVTSVSSGNSNNSKKLYYCWTHGLGHNKEHTSATCTNKAEGHVDDAHEWDMKGGNNSIRRRRGEKPVYRRPT